MRLAAAVRWSATLGTETEAKEMLPSPDLRMAGSGYIVLEAHGVEGRVVHAQGPRLRRQNRLSCARSRVKSFNPSAALQTSRLPSLNDGFLQEKDVRTLDTTVILASDSEDPAAIARGLPDKVPA